MKTTKKANNYNLVKWFLIFFITIFVGSFVTFISIDKVYADVSGSLTVSGLSTSEQYKSGTITWSLSGNTITGTATGKDKSGCSSASSSSGTLRLKNTKSSTAKLSFSYTVSVNGGSVKIAGASITSNDSYGPTDISADSYIDITIASATGAKTTSITLSNINLIVEKTVTGHFLVPDLSKGSYTVDEQNVNEEKIITKQSVESFALVASPASGYELFGWHVSSSLSSINESDVVSRESTFEYQSDADTFYVMPEFIKESTAIFKVNGKLYHDLNTADSKASSSYPIILSASGTLFSNSTGYSISKSNTLLIPKDANEAVVTTSPSTIASSSNPSAFRTLTIDKNVSITVNGAICLAGDQYNGNGRTAGPCGMIKFVDDSNSTITLKSGSKLYSWGYVWGNSGKIIAESGSNIYESFNLAGWRGGNATTGVLGNSYKVFAVNQFYVQNIEVEFEVYSGSQVYVRTCVTVTFFGTQIATVDFMGKSGMFVINSGFVTRKYNPANDTFEVVAHGNVTISTMKISISNYSMDSSQYVLPIPSAFSITIADGATVTTNQDIEFLPGSRMIINHGGKLNITNSKSVFFIDMDEWGDYAYEGGNKQFSTVFYTPNSAKRKKRTSISDAELDLNGTVTVASKAGLYTTESGAFIHSSEKTGDITFTDGPGNQTAIYYAVQSGNTISTYDKKNVTNAKLKNGAAYVGTDDEYFLTDDIEPGFNVVYFYDEDRWGEKLAEPEKYIVTFYDSKSNKSTTKERIQGETIDLLTWSEAQEAGFSYESYAIKGWTYSTNKFYNVGQTGVDDLIDDNVTLTAYWGGWFDYDGVNKYVKYDSSTSITYASGLYQIHSADSHYFNSEGGLNVLGGSTCYFGSNNEFITHIESSVENAPLTEWMQLDNGEYYYLNKGILQKDSGLIKLDTTGDGEKDTFYYIAEDGSGYRNGAYYLDIEPNTYNLTNGYYQFDENARLVLNEQGKSDLHPEIGENGEFIVGDNSGSYTFAPTTTPHGLYSIYTAEKTYLYYVKKDRYVVSNCTFYVTADMVNEYQINGITISAGLYYFDSNGHMYDSSMNEIVVSGQLTGKNFVMGAN